MKSNKDSEYYITASHLDNSEWNEYKQDIVSHYKVWSEFSRKAIQQEMTGFMYLKEDGTVQKTIYGNQLIVVANFRGTPYTYEGNEIPPHSVLIEENGLGGSNPACLSENCPAEGFRTGAAEGLKVYACHVRRM